MKHIFIIGSRGYHYNYGGWETFVSCLVDNYNCKKTTFHIASLNDNKKEKEEKISDNIYVNYINTKLSGSVKMLEYTINSFNYYLKAVNAALFYSFINI